MIKDFHNFLSLDHFLDKSVERSEITLLMRKIISAAFTAELYVSEHDDITDQYDQRQLPVQNKDQCQCTDNLNKALDHHGKTVVQSIRYRIDIIGKAAHGIPVRVCIEITKRQLLHFVKQVLTDLTYDFLCDNDHDLCIAKCGHHTSCVNAGGKCHCFDQSGHIAGNDIVIHDRFEHIGAKQIGQGTDGNQHCHDQQQKFMISHIVQQIPKRLPEISRPFSAHHSSHSRSPLSAEIHRFPDKSDSFSATLHVSRRH